MTLRPMVSTWRSWMPSQLRAMVAQSSGRRVSCCVRASWRKASMAVMGWASVAVGISAVQPSYHRSARRMATQHGCRARIRKALRMRGAVAKLQRFSTDKALDDAATFGPSPERTEAGRPPPLQICYLSPQQEKRCPRPEPEEQPMRPLPAQPSEAPLPGRPQRPCRPEPTAIWRRPAKMVYLLTTTDPEMAPTDTTDSNPSAYPNIGAKD